MAHYPSGSITAAYLDALGMGDHPHLVDRLGDSISPVIDIWRQPEWGLLRGEVHFARLATSVAVAARFSTIELTLPTTSTALVVVERIHVIGNDIDAQIDSGNAVAANPLTSRGLPVDDRYHALGQVSQLLITTGDTAAGTNLTQWRCVGREAVPTWILAPGSRLFLSSTGVNLQISCSILWRERAFFKTEVVR